MIKFVVLASRPSEWSKHQFLEWWRGPHAEAAKKLPGLIGYTHGKAELDFDRYGLEPEWDGLAELYFEDRDALDLMLESSEWKAAVKDTANMGGKRIALVMDEADLLSAPPGKPTVTPPSSRLQSYPSVLNTFNLQNKTALIVGGHGDMASIMAHTLADLGCNVVLAARKENLCEELAGEISEKHEVESLGLHCDVTNKEKVRKTVKETVDRFGSLDILVNSAGTFWAGPPEDISVDGWSKVVDVNLTGTFLCCQEAAKYMIEFGGGTIINITSSGGLMSFPPEGGEVVPYTTTKAAVIKLTKDLAVSWAQHGIRVNALAPGSIDSGFTDSIDKQGQAWLRERIPMRRFGRPEELSGALAFLASDSSSFVTGHTLVVDGGQTT
ncbi:SDR family oxidoreductase [Alteribacillus sp. YIM 98480]|uniref:SDR family oxidoreductase n=1 Tax=Alteribacillus sp. YIM 98480 TaxID=2606599 RepID=UPI00131BB2F5|nr:SDR family oxidoreductase [Alteribacillus sp. YIM 98480]